MYRVVSFYLRKTNIPGVTNLSDATGDISPCSYLVQRVVRCSSAPYLSDWRARATVPPQLNYRVCYVLTAAVQNTLRRNAVVNSKSSDRLSRVAKRQLLVVLRVWNVIINHVFYTNVWRSLTWLLIYMS